MRVKRPLQPRPALSDSPPLRIPPSQGWLIRAVERYGWLLAMLVGVALYLPTLAYDFTYDDLQIVVENNRIRDLTKPARYLATSWWDNPGRGTEYRPATMATFALNYAAAGLKPAGFHVVNIVLHGLLCALLWLLAMRLFRNAPLALFASILFAIHPVHIEAVAGVVGRAELLVTLGFLATLLAAQASLDAGAWRGRATWCGATFLAAALAVFSKEHGVMLLPTLPLLALIPPPGKAGQPLAPSRDFVTRRLRALLPALGAVALAVLLYLIARKMYLGSLLRPKGFKFGPLDNSLVLLEGLPRYLGAIGLVANYALMLVAPFRPSPDYSLRAITPISGLGDPSWIPGMVLLILSGAGVFLLRRRPAARFGLLFMMITFFIGSNLILTIGTVMAERLLYLPSAGFCLLAGALILGEERPLSARRLKLLGIAGLWGGALVAQHFRYLPTWRTNKTLFAYMVQRVPQSARAQNTYACILMSEGKMDEAIGRLRQAIQIAPNYFDAVLNLGVAYFTLGRDQEALVYFVRAYNSDPGKPQVNYHLAKILTRQGKAEEAEEILHRGIRESHQSPLAYLLLGAWLSDQHRWQESIPFLEHSLPLVDSGDWVPGTLALAQSRYELGDYAKASVLLQELIRADPRDQKIRLLQARTLNKQGHPEQARAILQEILARDPGQAEAKALMKELDRTLAPPKGSAPARPS